MPDLHQVYKKEFFTMIICSCIVIGSCSEQQVENSDSTLIVIAKFCDAASAEAKRAVEARESGVDINTGIEDLETRFLNDHYMLSYTKNIWQAIYRNDDLFRRNNIDQMIREQCFSELVEKAISDKDKEVITFACANIADQDKTLAGYRDKGVSIQDIKSKFMRSANKGDKLLEKFGGVSSALEKALKSIDFVYANSALSPDQIYQSSLSSCVAQY